MEEKENKKKNIDIIIETVLIIIIILLLYRNYTLCRDNKNFQENQNKPIPSGNVDIIEITCDKYECKKVIESISFSQDKVYLKKGTTTKLITIIKPTELASSSELTWQSSDPNVATVDSNGVVRAISIGTTTITVTGPDGKVATCVVQVTADDIAVEKITLVADKTTIPVGSSTQVIAKISPENATNRDIVWKSSDANVASVDNNGLVRGVGTGTVTITAMTRDGEVVDSITITVVNEEENESEVFEVFDTEHTPVTWDGSTDLDIFGKTAYTMDGKIAPESSNVYQFTVKNSTKYNLKYQINFIETNNYNINMKYKLKKNDTYIIDNYVSASELNIENMNLNVGENDTYYLEWKWVSSSNDTAIGETIGANYGLKIDINAEGRND